MDEKKRLSLEALLAQCDPEVPLQDIDWGPDVGMEDVQAELLANVDPDEIGWDWDVSDEV